MASAIMFDTQELADECMSPSITSKFGDFKGEGQLGSQDEFGGCCEYRRQMNTIHATENDSFLTGHESEIETVDEIPSPVQCQEFYEMLKDRCNANIVSCHHSAVTCDNANIVTCCKATVVQPHTADIQRQISALSNELENVHLATSCGKKCHFAMTCNTSRSARSVPRMGTKLDFNKSSLSTAAPKGCLAKSQSPTDDSMSRLRSSNNNDTHFCDGSQTSSFSKFCRQTATSDTKTQDNSERHQRVSQMCQTDDEDVIYPLGGADILYTNLSHLQHTITIQQQLFQQQMDGQRDGTRHSPDVENNTYLIPESSISREDYTNKVISTEAENHNSSRMEVMDDHEWVVKRRADGSRYITRRPIRNRFLKERARKVAEERCGAAAGGMTTDDDAASELKVGRYWKKEDRKIQLEKARSKRREKEMMFQQHLENTREVMSKGPNIVELSRRKMMKHKGRKALDDFTTLQELLAHGSRDPDGKMHNPLLSVTTV